MDTRYLWSRNWDSLLGAAVGFMAPMYVLTRHCYDVFSCVRQGDVSSIEFSLSWNKAYDDVLSLMVPVFCCFDTSYEGLKRGREKGFYDALNFLREYEQKGQDALFHPFFNTHPRYFTAAELFPLVNTEMLELKRNLTILKENSAILKRIDNLPSPPNVTLLDSKEITTFKKIIDATEDKDDKNKLSSQLKNYESYLKSRCPITLVEIREIDPAQAITIQLNEAKDSIGSTYDKEAIKTHIQMCIERGNEAKDPYRNIALKNKDALTLYVGLDRSIMQFINDVRAINHSLNIEISRKILTQKELRSARIAFYQRSGMYRERPKAITKSNSFPLLRQNRR